MKIYEINGDRIKAEKFEVNVKEDNKAKKLYRSLGLEEMLQEKDDKMIKNGAIIGSRSIYVEEPKKIEKFDSVESLKMYRAGGQPKYYNSYVDTYWLYPTKVKYKGQHIDDFCSRLISVGSGFLSPIIWVPATLLGLPDTFQGTSSDNYQIEAQEWKTIKAINIEDVDGLYTADYILGSTTEKGKWTIENRLKSQYENITKEATYFKRQPHYYDDSYMQSKAFNYYIQPYGTRYDEYFDRLY
jgi:hypothetical protein